MCIYIYILYIYIVFPSFSTSLVSFISNEISLVLNPNFGALTYFFNLAIIKCTNMKTQQDAWIILGASDYLSTLIMANPML